MDILLGAAWHVPPGKLLSAWDERSAVPSEIGAGESKGWCNADLIFHKFHIGTRQPSLESHYPFYL
jgi:hypothetical protein